MPWPLVPTRPLPIPMPSPLAFFLIRPLPTPQQSEHRPSPARNQLAPTEQKPKPVENSPWPLALVPNPANPTPRPWAQPPRRQDSAPVPMAQALILPVKIPCRLARHPRRRARTIWPLAHLLSPLDPTPVCSEPWGKRLQVMQQLSVSKPKHLELTQRQSAKALKPNNLIPLPWARMPLQAAMVPQRWAITALLRETIQSRLVTKPKQKEPIKLCWVVKAEAIKRHQM